VNAIYSRVGAISHIIRLCLAARWRRFNWHFFADEKLTVISTFDALDLGNSAYRPAPQTWSGTSDHEQQM